MSPTYEHADIQTVWKGLIELEALDVPFKENLRNVLKQQAAEYLNEAACSLSRARGMLERQMGRRLAQLNKVNGPASLGLSCPADYVAERLDLGHRSAQEMERTARAMADLPLLRQANDEGRLTASHIRELVRVITPETEAAWVETASKYTVRGLREEIKARIEAGTVPEVAKPEVEDLSVTVSFRAPAEFGPRWTAAIEFFRKLEGCDKFPPGYAAESFAAEYLSGAGLPGADQVGDDISVGCTLSCGQGSGDAGQPIVLPSPSAGEAGANARLLGAGLGQLETAALDRATPGAGSPDAPAERRPLNVCAYIDGKWVSNPPRGAITEYRERMLEEDFDRWKYLDDNRKPPAPLPEWLMAYDVPLSSDPHVLDAELVALESARRELNGMTGRILFTMGRYGLFTPMGFRCLEHYARERLGLAASTARRLAAIEKRIMEIPEVRDAYYAGEIGLVKVWLLIRILQSRDLEKWLERARQVTVKRLTLEVQAVLHRADLAESRLIDESWLEAINILPEGTDLVCYTSALDEKARGKDFLKNTARLGTRTVTFWMEPDAAEVWDTAVERCRALEGRDIEVWECADRFVEAFFAEYDRKDPLGYAMNHKVCARDGHRCTTPGCTRRRCLNSHHLHPRGQGGPNTMENQTAVCRVHHPYAVHTIRAVEVKGTAPHGLTWRLGVKKNDEALLTIGPGEKILGRVPPPRRITPLHLPWTYVDENDRLRLFTER